MKNISIAIIGAGGFARELHKLIDEINAIEKKWDLVGFYDNEVMKGDLINGLPVLGSDDDALGQNLINNFAIGIGSPVILRKLSERFISTGKKFPNIIHPQIDIEEEFNCIGFGNIFTHGFYLTRNISIGNFNIFNTGITIGHDVNIGSYNVFLPNVQISGNVNIADENVFGMNSSVYQKRKIGSRNVIGAHSFVVTNIGNSNNIFGTPAVTTSLNEG
jgi:sugar O-acyltransferase (sialic acid O-acetyltransferase NeuD family)